MSDQATERRSLGTRVVELSQRPDDTLIVQADRVVTADEAVQRATALATVIVDRDPDGTGPLVVLGSRSPETIISIFAVLLAGRGVVIVEDDQPDARVNDIVGRLASSVVVVSDPAQARERRLTARAVAPGEHAAAATTEPVSVADARSPAYVVFTSGSTGRAKGVVLSNADAEAWCDDRALEMRERGWSVLPCHSPLSFAAGLTPILAALEGTPIDLLPQSARGPLALAEWILDRQFAGIELVPSLAHAIAGATPRPLESLRLVTTAGEPLEWATVETLRAMAGGDLTIESRYGSSEALLMMRRVVPPDEPLGTGQVPMGTPHRGRRVELEPVNGLAGAPEELVVYGGPLADGYWDDPDQTARRFGVTAEGERFYRTGDLATVDADGVHHFRGRVDDLVKIRGLLVEPAEAERVLRDVEGVAAASVFSIPGAAGPRLVGHVQLEPGAVLSHLEVRRALQRELPAHLVPSVLARHDELPITERGKVDRAALRAVELDPWRDRPVLPPRDPYEAAIVSAVAELLDLPEVSRDDDLFELGADSLTTQELVARLSDRFDIDLAVDTVVTSPRLDRLASRLRHGGQLSSTDDIVVLNPGGSRHPVVVFAGAAGTVVSFRPLAEALGPDQPVWVVHQKGVLAGGPTDRSVESWATRAIEAVRDRGLVPPFLLVGHSAGGLVAFEAATQCLERGDEVRLLAVLDTALPTRERGPDQDRPIGAGVARPRGVGETVGWVVRGVRNRAMRPVWRFAIRRRPPRTLEHYTLLMQDAVRLAERYRPEPLATGGVTTVVHPVGSDAHEGWAQLLDVEVLEVSGGHNSMLEQPHVDPIVAMLRTRIDRACGE